MRRIVLHSLVVAGCLACAGVASAQQARQAYCNWNTRFQDSMVLKKTTYKGPATYKSLAEFYHACREACTPQKGCVGFAGTHVNGQITCNLLSGVATNAAIDPVGLTGYKSQNCPDHLKK